MIEAYPFLGILYGGIVFLVLAVTAAIAWTIRMDNCDKL